MMLGRQIASLEEGRVEGGTAGGRKRAEEGLSEEGRQQGSKRAKLQGRYRTEEGTGQYTYSKTIPQRGPCH